MANEYFDAHEVVFWIVAIPVAAFAFLFFGLFPLILFIASFFETIRVLRLIPPLPDDLIRPSRALSAALAHGFTLVGQFSDEDKGFKRSLHSLALSPDCLVVLHVVHRKIGAKYQLITQYPGQRWMITTTSDTVPDMSGLDFIEAPPAGSFDPLFQHHQSRINSIEEHPIPFAPHTVPADFHHHDQCRVDAMAKTRHARYLTANRGKWRYTLKGTLKILAAYYSTAVTAFLRPRPARPRPSRIPS